jgi:hypothetical protein
VWVACADNCAANTKKTAEIINPFVSILRSSNVYVTNVMALNVRGKEQSLSLL